MTNTKPVTMFGALLCSSLLRVLTGCAASDTTDAARRRSVMPGAEHVEAPGTRLPSLARTPTKPFSTGACTCRGADTELAATMMSQAMQGIT